MAEFSSPSLIEVPPNANLNTLLMDRVASNPGGTVIERRPTPDGPWQAVTGQEFDEQVVAVARGLVALGVEPGDRVAIMSRTRYEWTLLDFGIWAAGAVPVPVYETSSDEQVQWILADAGVSVAVVETAQHADAVAAAQGQVPGLRDVLVIDDGAVEQLRKAGEAVEKSVVDERRTATKLDDLATIIYTSGATGRPKGVELTHRNFVYLALNGRVGLAEVVAHEGGRTILFLPLAHVFARYIEVVVICAGTVLAHTPDTRHLVDDLQSFKPTFLLAVPRVFEKVYNSAEQKAGTGAKLRIFRWAARVSISYSRALDAGTPKLGLRLQHAIADQLVYKNLRHAMGGQLKYSVSGGAPLGERLGHFYRGVGLRVLEGYGLTETTAPTAVNMPGLTKIGTVGPPFPGTALRADDQGELYVKGDHVFRGYRNQPELTAEVLGADGWFRTGDVGTFDSDGYLSITGRKKEIIVTAGGKNVAPALLEDRLRSHPLVSQVVVVGDQRPFIGALVTLDPEMLPGWLTTHNLPDTLTVDDAAVHPEVLAALDRAVARANRAVSRAESIRKIAVLTTDFTETNGYLTPSLKVKRSLVLQDFADRIDALYGGPAK